MGPAGGLMKKILVFTDAWYPQVSGVVTCWDNVKRELCSMGHEVKLVSPYDFKIRFDLPAYSEIAQPVDLWNVFKIVGDFKPDVVHITTPEGAVGWAGKLYCYFTNKPFTTSYHTKIPEYVKMYAGIPLRVSYLYEKNVHRNARKVLVTTKSMKEELGSFGFNEDKMVVWSRGVNLEKFSPRNKIDLGIKGPILMYVGRVSIEKDLELFLDCKVPGTKVIVGDGPHLKYLKNKYRDVIFTGYKFGDELYRYYASADVFVFPSSSDTFGLVLLEAIASGTPVAALNVPGPKDVLEEGVNGYFRGGLENSIVKCLSLDRNVVAESAQKWSWRRCAEIFIESVT